ncbi:MAG: hypothetical protein LBV27_07400 [Oscillospiraceae bacterium]|jgi:hypothetical protein|nr:hypothetical protein [Oscillospiraceae bacterium]
MKRRVIAVLVCVCFVVALLFSAVSVSENIHHACSGDACQICLYISHIAHTLKQLRVVAFTAVSIILCGIAALFVIAFRGPQQAHHGLISLKVQLNR